MLIMQHFGDMPSFGPTNAKLQDMIHDLCPLCESVHELTERVHA